MAAASESTGPRNSHGQAASRYNAVKHGINAPTDGQRLRAQLSPRLQTAATPESKSGAGASACRRRRKPLPAPATRTIQNHFREIGFGPSKSEKPTSRSPATTSCRPSRPANCRPASRPACPGKPRRNPTKPFQSLPNPERSNRRRPPGDFQAILYRSVTNVTL
jgi:hypothetical protein